MGLTQALSDIREPLSLGTGVDLAFAVAPILRRGRPNNGGRTQVVRLPQAYHESHGVLLALLGLPTVTRHDEPSVVDGQVVRGHVHSELAGGRDNPRCHLKGEARTWARDHAGDTPLEDFQIPGTLDPGVDCDRARRERGGGVKSGGWNGRCRGLGEGKALM